MPRGYEFHFSGLPSRKRRSFGSKIGHGSRLGGPRRTLSSDISTDLYYHLHCTLGSFDEHYTPVAWDGREKPLDERSYMR
jgi:hypothetical protein